MDQHPLHSLVSSDAFYHELNSRLVDPNEGSKEGVTLLHAAAWSSQENTKILHLLLDRGADVNVKSQGGHTPLHVAVVRRNRKAVVILTNAGASVNSEDTLGRSSLHLAITRQCLGWSSSLDVECDMWIVESLLDQPGINLNALDRGRETPLMLAVREQNAAAVRALLRKGADPNFPNRWNKTPLHMAIQVPGPSYEIIKSLMSNGADIYREDNLKQTPIDILIQNVVDDDTMTFAVRCVWFIAFQYHIRDPLRRKLRRIPSLLSYLDECCNELELMKRTIVHDHFTLYDLAQGCLEVRAAPNLCTLLVEILMSAMFTKYFEFILCRMTREDLRGVLVKVCGVRVEEIPEDASCIALYHEILGCYIENEVLTQRLLSVKEFLMKQKVTYFFRKN